MPADMSLTSLPVEILDAVCEPLAACPSTLARLALTCSAVNHSATRVLYRSISVSQNARNLPLVPMLATRPDLAGLVHDFSITIDDACPVLRAFYSQLRVALHQMPRLSSLVVRVDAGASWILPTHDQPLADLKRFVCSFPLDAHVCAFLRQTPSLRSLEISESSRTQVLPDTHVPLLDSYTGPAALLPSLASRPLSTIHLTGDLRIEDVLQAAGAPDVGRLNSESISFPNTAPKHTACEGYATARKTLQVFIAITSAPPAELLEALAAAYPDLAYLRLTTTSAFWEAPDMVRVIRHMLLFWAHHSCFSSSRHYILASPRSSRLYHPCLPSSSQGCIGKRAPSRTVPRIQGWAITVLRRSGYRHR